MSLGDALSLEDALYFCSFMVPKGSALDIAQVSQGLTLNMQGGAGLKPAPTENGESGGRFANRPYSEMKSIWARCAPLSEFI